MNSRNVFSRTNAWFRLMRSFLSRPQLDYLWLAILSIYIFFVWFEGNNLYFGGDIMYPFRPSLNISHILYAWTDNNGGVTESSMMYYFLYGFFFLADKIGVSLATAQRVYLYINFILPGLGMYYLVSVVYAKVYPTGSGKRVACWAAALFYMFCPTLLRQPQVYWFYGVFPFILAFFIQTVDAPDWKGKIKFSLLAALFCFGLLLFTPNGQMILILLLIIMLYSLLYLLSDRHRTKRLLTSGLVFGVVVSLVNLGVVLPFLIMLLTQGGQVLASFETILPQGRWMDEVPFAMLRNLSGGIHGLGPEGTRYPPFGLYFGSSPVMYFVNLLLTMAAFGALMLKPRSKTALFLTFYFALVAILGIVIATGPNPPFGEAWKWLVERVLVLRVFRTTGQVATIIALGYAALIGLTISELYGRLPGKISAKTKAYLTEKERVGFKYIMSSLTIVIAVSLVLANGWPMVTGALYKTPMQWPNNQQHEIPSSYYELARWVDKQGNPQDYRLMLVPDVPSYQALRWPTGDIYVAAVMPNISPAPTIFTYAGREGTMAPLLKPTYKYIQNDWSLMAKLAGLLNVKYYFEDGYDNSYWGLSRLVFAQRIPNLPQIDNATVIQSPGAGAGVSGAALTFDGVDDYVEVPSSASLHSNTLTIEAWIKASSPPQNIDVVPVVTKRGNGNEYQFGLYYGQVYVAAWNSHGTSLFDIHEGTKVTDTGWHHIAFAADGATVSTYLDGKLQGSQSQNGTMDNTSSAVRIGAEPTMPRYFSGTIDEVRVLNRALTGDEVKASYERHGAALENGVVALWHFDEASGTIALDDSSNANNGTIYGAQYTPYVPPRPESDINVAPNWSVYAGNGSFHTDDEGNIVLTSEPKSGFGIHEPLTLDYNTYRYLVVRVKGDSNVNFDVVLKRGVYIANEIIYQAYPRACQSEYTTYAFEILPSHIRNPEPVKYITLAVENHSDKPGSVYFKDVMFAKNIDELQSISTGARYLQSFDKLSLFSIEDKSVFPRVYSTSKVDLINGSVEPDLVDYLGNADFSVGKPVLFVQDQLSPENWQFVKGLNLSGNSPEITFEQLNPTKYVAHVNNSSGQPFFLVLSTQFNDFWKAKIDGKEASEHLMANGYANSWYIDKTGSFTVVLNYEVQTYYHIALMMSLLAFIGCLGYIGRCSLGRHKR